MFNEIFFHDTLINNALSFFDVDECHDCDVETIIYKTWPNFDVALVFDNLFYDLIFSKTIF